MEPGHPIDAEIRAWLKRLVENKADFSVKVGHSSSWLHKYVNGDGHATIDDLVRLAALLIGLNLPLLSEADRKLLRLNQELGEADRQDVMAYAEHRVRLARRAPLKESSAPVARIPRVRGRRAHEKR